MAFMEKEEFMKMIQSKYKERFFTTPQQVIENQKKDIKRDSEVHTFEELFKEKEG